jgi:hypothetical protein
VSSASPDHGGYRAGFDAGMARANATIAELRARLAAADRLAADRLALLERMAEAAERKEQGR